jgi:DNA-binding CsgD family transcriptional regulator
MCSDKATEAGMQLDIQSDLNGTGTSLLYDASISAINGHIALRQGYPEAAMKHSCAAFDLIELQHWGVAAGIPIATAVSSATKMRRLGDAETLLAVPVPEAMFATPFSLNYLHARAEFCLAVGDPHAALADFQLCGSLMARWQIDLPCVTPWRCGAAHAYHQLGMTGRARSLIREQVELTGSAHPRTKGISLRAQASVSDPARRPSILREAADLLSSCGDRLELALALVDLVVTLTALGQHQQARGLARKARKLATQCGIAVDESVQSAADDDPPARTPSADFADGAAGKLSDAQFRVARLAALGCTNREIAQKLHVTVSTVEQHLSQAYRRLNVRSRMDLPLLSAEEPVSSLSGPRPPAGSGSRGWTSS